MLEFRLPRPSVVSLSILLGLGASTAWGAAASSTVAAEPPPAAQAPAPTDEPAVDPAALRQALTNASELIEQLRTELAESRTRVATLERALREAGVEPDAERLAREQTTADREAARRAEEERRQKLQELREKREAEEREQQIEQALAPGWYYTWQIGYIDNGSRQTTFVKTDKDGAVVFIGDRTSVDRRQIILRGTFENTSRAPYRYTFEIRVAEDGPFVVGIAGGGDRISSTRYQTPVLQPGELHRWEVRMTVRDSLQVRTAAIGNVRADPPSSEPVAAPAVDPAELSSGVKEPAAVGS